MVNGRQAIPVFTYQAWVVASLIKIMIGPEGTRLRRWAGEKLSPEQEPVTVLSAFEPARNLDFSVRPNGAVHQWRKDPPRKLSVGPGS